MTNGVPLTNKPKSAFWDIAQTTLFAFILAQVIVRFVVQPHHVLGASMEPSLQDGDYILTDKFSYRLRDPRRGEIIIFHPPQNSATEYIKRIIGLPGDTVEFNKGKVLINNQELAESYLDPLNLASTTTTIKGAQEITVPEGSFLVLGDNRGNSYDSRHFGLISEESIEGRALFRYWPITEIKAMGVPNFSSF